MGVWEEDDPPRYLPRPGEGGVKERGRTASIPQLAGTKAKGRCRTASPGPAIRASLPTYQAGHPRQRLFRLRRHSHRKSNLLFFSDPYPLKRCC